jgi:hypothetical protein
VSDSDNNFSQKLLKKISVRLDHVSENYENIRELPKYIKLIDSKSYKNPSEYGHPIEWLLMGCAGIHAFMIGRVLIHSDMKENSSEQNFYPPIITQNFAHIGMEYTYSQVAIVIVSNKIEECTYNWLKSWCDDHRYFRKVMVSGYEANDIEGISRYIVERLFFPWNSIKSYSNDKIERINLFDSEEDNDD